MNSESPVLTGAYLENCDVTANGRDPLSVTLIDLDARASKRASHANGAGSGSHRVRV